MGLIKQRIVLIMIGIGILAVAANDDTSRNQVELVLYNGNIITVDDDMPRAESVAVSGERIVYVGSSETALSLASKDTELVDLKGKTLIPGFNDDHTHTLGAGAFYLQPMLWGLSCEEVAEVVRKEAVKKKPGETITGNSWDYPTCPDPHKSMLDKAAPDNPVFLVQYSGHAAWVNSAMLEKMGIDRETKNPEGGQIVRDESGEPTGVLRDTAMGSGRYSEFIGMLLSREKHREVLDKALEMYREAGITSVQDNTWEPLTARLLNKYKKEGRLTCRFTCWPYGQARGAHYLMALASFDDKWVRKGLWKYFADGAFSTRTGWMTEPYADEPGNYGEPRYPPEEIEKIALEAAQNRRQITFHAIGDKAVHEVINAVEKAQERYPWTKDLRFRMEHVQLVMPEDIPRMRKLGMVAAVQPFTISTPDKDVTLLGPERARRAYPFYSLFKAGIPVAFGSDVPAEVDYQPLLCIYYAVTRMSKDGTQGPLNPHERFTPEEALYCYTMGSAYAEFMEREKGSITIGKLADVVVLSDDLTKVPHEKIKDINVEMTVVGGKIVHER
jgi:predicted amidohydrolase YtcJ